MVTRPTHPMTCWVCRRGYPNGSALTQHVIADHDLLDRVVAGDLPDDAKQAIRDELADSTEAPRT